MMKAARHRVLTALGCLWSVQISACGTDPGELAEWEADVTAYQESPSSCLEARAINLGGDRLNVRSGPSTAQSIVARMVENDRANVLGEAHSQTILNTDLWYHVSVAGQQGWATAAYLECVQLAPDPDPPPSSCGDGPVPSDWIWPIPSSARIIQSFGRRVTYQTCGFHTGVDISGAEGAPILAPADGRVVHVGPLWLSGQGVGRGPYSIVIQHAPNFYTTYGHNSAATVSIGDCVSPGQQIGNVGNLGYSFGAHLHLEVVSGTAFTGNWQTPFVAACQHYEDFLDYATP